jgi:N-acetylglucosaminyl-diphospho-decaprenol L-rhamnosyltransferase
MPNSRFEQVTIVSVSYQSRPIIDSFSATLKAFPHVVIIDNGSKDGTATEIRRCIPHARLIERYDNIGFASANNQAMQQVHTPFALLLNPDSSIDPANLAILMDTLDCYPTAGAVAPQSWRADGVAQRCFRQAFYEVPRNKGPYQIAEGTCCTGWLHGCCLLLRTDAFKRIGGFDENFFLYYEDDDLCLRLQKAGFACLFEPRASARHLGGASSTSSLRTSFIKSFHYARSRHLAIDKYLGSRASALYLAKILLAAVPATLAYAILLRRKYAVRWAAWGCSAVSSAFVRLALRTKGKPDQQSASTRDPFA